VLVLIHRLTVRLAGALEGSGFGFLEQSAAGPEAAGRQDSGPSSDSRGIRSRRFIGAGTAARAGESSQAGDQSPRMGFYVPYALIAQHNSSSPYEDLKLQGK
jgi:hypothetical protein